MTITVVGGGLAGLIAAIECAERGADVSLFEARSLLGGRARSTTGPFVANHGPHVVYQDGALWQWLHERRMAEPAGRVPMRPAAFRFVHDGRMRRTPPRAALRALRLARRAAPSDVSFREWVAGKAGDEVADVLSGFCHVFTFTHDPGALAADFVLERLRRNLKVPSPARYVIGGWATIVERLVERARALGVEMTTGVRLDELPDRPTIVAVELSGARKLLGDDTLRWTGARTALLDVGFVTRPRDPYIVFDLDDGVFAECFSAIDRTLAPTGHALVQAQVGLRDDESLDDGVAQIESVLDGAFPGWRGREVWRRRQVVSDASGALDLPGTTWRDRPAIDRGDGIFLCGDMVAAPGALSEVSVTSAVQAASLAVAAGKPRFASTP